MKDLESIIIIDVGGHSIRCGTAASDIPLATFSPFLSKKLYSLRDGEIKEDHTWMESAVENGKIIRWPIIEDILKQFIHTHHIDPKKSFIIFTLSLAANKADRDVAENLLFDKFFFDAVYITSDAYLSFIASGKSTGCIVQLGHSITQILPVSNRSPLVDKARVFEVAGSHISDQLITEIQEVSSGKEALPIIKKRLDDFKEAHCYVAQDYEAELRKLETHPGHPNDGGFFNFVNTHSPIARRYQPRPPSKVYFDAPEALFQPSMIGKDGFGLIEKLYETIIATPPHFHGLMYDNIVLSGGTAKLKGLKERLAAKIDDYAPRIAKVTVSLATDSFTTDGVPDFEDEEGYASTSTHDRSEVSPQGGSVDLSLAAFKGATILAQRPDFESLLTYREDRPIIAMRKSSSRLSNRSLRFSFRNSASHLAAPISKEYDDF